MKFVQSNQSDLPCPVWLEKISLFLNHPNQIYIFAVPPHSKGRFAIVTDVESGMRWTRLALLTRARMSRTVKSCGPDASTLASSFAEGYFRETTVTRKPDHRGEREGNR
jgi:hypothetical protein